MKICTRCRLEKAATEFHKNNKVKCGLFNYCKACASMAALSWNKAHHDRYKENHARWKVAHPEKVKAWKSNWHTNNKEIMLKQSREWAKNNPEKRKASHKRWHLANPDWTNANKALRRAKEFNATPKWANKFFMQEAYALAKLRTKVMGFKWEVDHIIPLRNKYVCGLHCEQNLQVIPQTLNRQKNNHYVG